PLSDLGVPRLNQCRDYIFKRPISDILARHIFEKRLEATGIRNESQSPRGSRLGLMIEHLEGFDKRRNALRASNFSQTMGRIYTNVGGPMSQLPVKNFQIGTLGAAATGVSITMTPSEGRRIKRNGKLRTIAGACEKVNELHAARFQSR